MHFTTLLTLLFSTLIGENNENINDWTEAVRVARWAYQLNEIPLFDRTALSYCKLEGTDWYYVVDDAEWHEFKQDFEPPKGYREFCPN